MASPSSVFPSLHRKPRLSDAAVRESREAAIREAKQHVRDIVRNDWSFDPPSSLFATTSTSSSLSPVTSLESPVATTPTMSSSSSAPFNLERQPEVHEWRLRELASTSESETDGGGGPRTKETDPYRFESPDTVAASIAERRHRWRAEVGDETRWNPGLRFWMERRNAWTGAKKRRALRGSSKGLPEQRRPASGGDVSATAQSNEPVSGTILPEGQQGILSNGEANRNSLVTETQPETMEHRREETALGSSSTSEPLETLSLSKNGEHDNQESEKRLLSEDNDCDYESDESLVPVVEPLLPNSNPVRTSITPSIYSSVYSKVVVQGLTPTVPINLADVTKAIVEGWKADGQWPPKPAIPVPGSDVPARRKGAAQNTLSHQNPADETGSRSTRKDSHSHGSGVTQAVMKVLGFSHHPFHLRRSSRDGGQAEPEAGGGHAAMSRETAITEVPVVEDNIRAFR